MGNNYLNYALECVGFPSHYHHIQGRFLLEIDMTKSDGKPCKKCGGNEWNSDGYGKCKTCKSSLNKKWREANPEKVKKNNAESRQNHNKASSKPRGNNLDKARECSRKYRARNLDKRLEAEREWRRNNPDKCKAKKHARRTRKTNAGGSYTGSEWRDLCNQYGNKCLKCGRDDVKLTADHVIPVVMGGTSDISNIQPLCQSCNSSKGTKTKDYRTQPMGEKYTQRQLL
jgi:5-methylcytosine-specific restriction endonuclease McrA